MITIQHLDDNRIKIKDDSRRILVMEQSFNATRGYYRLRPVGKDTWELFWQMWELDKTDLKVQGIRVTKEKGKWKVYYKPPGIDSNAEKTSQTS